MKTNLSRLISEEKPLSAEHYDEAMQRNALALIYSVDNSDEIAFEELFPIETLQQIQDDFSHATGVASIITKTDGTPITKPSNFCDSYNELIQYLGDGCSHCLQTNDFRIDQMVQEGLGLMDAEASISIGGRQIAAWRIGQVRIKLESDDEISFWAKERGINDEKFKDAWGRVPVMSREHFSAIAQHLTSFAKQLSVIAFQNIKNAHTMGELEQAQNEIMREEENRDALLNKIKTQVYCVTDESTYGIVNEAHAAFFGVRKEELCFKNIADIFSQDTADLLKKSNAEVFKTGRASHSQEWMPHCSGTMRLLSITKEPVLHEDGSVDYVVCSAEDITEAELYKKQLEYISLHDKLTGLYNRAFFENARIRLEGSMEYPISIVLADVDGLKQINDTLGHDVGDRMLIACADALKKAIRPYDILARVGGDEFSIIMPRTVAKTGEEILRRVQMDILNNIENMQINLSFGVATANRKGIPLIEAYRKADDLMYRSKLNKGKNPKSRIMKVLMTSLGERDYTTEGHGKKLTELCNKIGEEIGLSSNKLDNLDLLSRVHDLRKVGIPDSILLKPGKLTDDEWTIMRQHPEKGYQIAQSSPYLAGVGELILKHHEKWDGSGYPLGLKKEEIPIECRILAIVDAFDAMTHDRPYCKARSKAEAIEEIQRNAGTQFDPDLVAIFVEQIFGLDMDS